ncbi:uncharacterized protein BJ212DRAFT_1488204 [Suillus subaureus]|uniref:CxC2-like cysteine cluster KDZ transposase-associated domain-containing protein n=1 Tax=Suillus subaureus TaxID=48587 RepID=A0A9P7DPU3_9AGAM|nr:uncharacterized protein BJ212DRAFT_1488204 [Suillus subaureus]KAG1799950.1 hypothetical protein BJ212DRAFT_1488204 [Suillus subaureus]
MSQSGHTGCPSKHPKLVRHTQPDTTQPSNHVNRHRMFSLQPSSQLALRTSYIPATLPEKEDENAVDTDAGPTVPTEDDPWNKMVPFNPSSEVDNVLGAPEMPMAEKRCRRTAGDTPISSWLPEHQMYMNKFLRLEGRGQDSDTPCACGVEDAMFRCQDCFSLKLACRSCTIGLHHNSPLHRIKEWRGRFFHPVSLKSMGLRIQLGHPPGITCRRPTPAFGDNFVIINVHGVHPTGLDFCGCEQEVSHFKQLLHACLFPSTVTDPRMVATFAVLEFFHILSFKSKVSAYEFYHSLAWWTDNTGITPIHDRYSVFLRIVHEWRNIKALKHSGRGHHPAGIGSTQDGDLAILCPACPHPGKNLPTNWETSPPTRWKYALFLAIDANFRLKHWMVLTDRKGPGLSQGWGHFVEENEYKQYLSNNGETLQEKSNCVSHNAVNMADTKSSRGLAATGVGTVDCTCHNMKLANGIGDLQKGEKSTRIGMTIDTR